MTASYSAQTADPPGFRKAVLAGVCLAAVTLLAGCGAARDGVRLSNAATTVPTEQALALPQPGGPAVVDIVERRYSNATQQDIYLFTSAATSGQNALRIKLYGPVGLQLDSEKRLGYSSIRPVEIAREIRSEFPGVALSTSPLFLQNNYGPFGYASGKGRQNDTCLYAWQQIRAPEASRTAFQNRGTIQVRLRLCEEEASEDKLLAVMYGYTVNGAFSAAGWNPYGEPPGADPKLGTTGNPIYPPASKPAAAQASSVQARSTQTRPAQARPAQDRQAQMRPVPRQRSARLSATNPDTVQQSARQSTIPLPVGEDIGGVLVPAPNCVSGQDGSTECM